MEFIRYYTNAELEETLRAWAEAYPGLVRLEQRTVIVLAPLKLLTTTERVALKALVVETKR